jgi:hypothetical protein
VNSTDAMMQKLDVVRLALRVSPKVRALKKAGRQRDSLLRALVPLYVTRHLRADELVTSGVTQRFWADQGVTVQATVMAKALREHVGYARRTRTGLQITPNGVKYVEAAIRE